MRTTLRRTAQVAWLTALLWGALGAAGPARDLIQPSAAEAAPRGQKRDRFQQVGLARTVRAGEDHGTCIERERQRGEAAVRGELQTGERGAVRGHVGHGASLIPRFRESRTLYPSH